MFNVNELGARYNSDAPFNKMVNLFMQLIESYGFTPSEIRQGLFYAQWKHEFNNIQQVIRTEAEWKQLAELHLQMRELIGRDYDALAASLKDGSK